MQLVSLLEAIQQGPVDRQLEEEIDQGGGGGPLPATVELFGLFAAPVCSTPQAGRGEASRGLGTRRSAVRSGIPR